MGGVGKDAICAILQVPHDRRMTVRWQKNSVTKLPGRVAASGDGLRDWAWLQVVHELRNPLAPIRSAADLVGAVRAGGCGGVISVQPLPKHEGGLAPEVPVPIWT